jgi:hypothetical protein
MMTMRSKPSQSVVVLPAPVNYGDMAPAPHVAAPASYRRSSRYRVGYQRSDRPADNLSCSRLDAPPTSSFPLTTSISPRRATETSSDLVLLLSGSRLSGSSRPAPRLPPSTRQCDQPTWETLPDIYLGPALASVQYSDSITKVTPRPPTT